LAAALSRLGLNKGDRIAILSNTRPEWAYFDMAILGLGCVTVPIYQNSTPEDVQFILEDSQARILIVENPSIAERLRETLSAAKSLEKIISIESEKKPSGSNFDSNEEMLSSARMIELGGVELTRNPRIFKESALKVDSDDRATILYTSGTTGRPKGVVLTHTAIISEVSEVFPLLGVSPRDRTLTFLPFAHILGRIEIWGHVFIGYTMAYAESIERVKDNMQAAKPTLMVAVPRVFEKIYYGILAQAEISPIKKRVFDWAISVGRQMSKYKVEKQPVPVDLALKYQLAKRLVFDTIAEKMGGHVRFAFSGGAPLSPAIAEFFHAAGLLVF
jgi:long-chain acyl-CoA synthetase